MPSTFFCPTTTSRRLPRVIPAGVPPQKIFFALYPEIVANRVLGSMSTKPRRTALKRSARFGALTNDPI